MRRHLIGALASLAAWAPPAEAQTIGQYRQWDELTRSTFVAGFVNGMHLASVNIAIADGSVDDRTPHYNRAWDPLQEVNVWRCASGWSMAQFMNIARMIGAGPLMVIDTEVDGEQRSKPS